MNPRETFVRCYCIGNGADVVVVVACTGLAAFPAARGRALVDELPAHQRIYFADHRTLAHAERSRDDVRA